MLRRGYELLNRRDIEAWIRLFHPDVEAHDLAEESPDAPVAEDITRCESGLPTWTTST